MISGLLQTGLFSPLEDFIDYWIQQGTQPLSRLAVDLPATAWWLPALVLLVLGGTAAFDALRGRIPDPPIILGLLLTTAAQGFYANWPLAGQHLLIGFIVAFALWGLNQLYYNAFKNDAIGMGDAKWTALAVAAFDLKPALWAWVIGAWLGLLWMGTKASLFLLRRYFSQGAMAEGKHNHNYYERIHFAPFLFLGLLAALYWYYLR